MNNEIMVSIICDAFNHERYIKDALEGFVNQKTNFLFEVLVHDDASNDNTVQIIKFYERNYPNIVKPIYQSVNQHSKNISVTNKFQFPRVRGKYIAICEGDDYWIDEFKLQKQFDYMESHPKCSLVAHNSLKLMVNGNYFVKFTKRDYSKPDLCELNPNEIIDNHLLFHTSSMFFRYSYYTNNRAFLNNIRSFDYVMKILLATEGDVYVLPDIMSVYRKGTASSWSLKFDKNLDFKINHLKLSIDNLRKIDEYREFKFHKIIMKNILKREFDILVALKDFDSIRNYPYKDLYGELTFKQKILLYLNVFSPRLYFFVLDIKRFIESYICRGE